MDHPGLHRSDLPLLDPALLFPYADHCERGQHVIPHSYLTRSEIRMCFPVRFLVLYYASMVLFLRVYPREVIGFFGMATSIQYLHLAPRPHIMWHRNFRRVSRAHIQ